MATVQSITQGPYEITFDVTFSGAMEQNDDLTSPANYVFDGGAYTRKVDIISSSVVRLWTELVYGQTTYTLTVYNVQDEDSNPIPTGYNTATISPFLSDADFANTNGMVRTWRVSQRVHGDTYRAYLAGQKGIDVFRKVSGTTYNRWAQVFDAYGVGAMHVANYPGDLSITDTDPPYLDNRIPSAGGFAASDTLIQFTIYDDTTTVEIPEVTIYINGNVIFRGSYGGWLNNYDGIIEVERHSLDVTLYPPSDFVLGSLIVVRVVAADLFNNSMDSEYSFVIASPISSGFGVSAFGTTPFGGI